MGMPSYDPQDDQLTLPPPLPAVCDRLVLLAAVRAAGPVGLRTGWAAGMVNPVTAHTFEKAGLVRVIPGPPRRIVASEHLGG